MTTPIHERRRDHKLTDRRCEVCRKQTNGLSSLCILHRYRRSCLGSVKVTRALKHTHYAPLIGLATKHLKKHKTPSDVIEAMQRFLQPPPMPKHYKRGRGATIALLVSEMQRWQDSRYRKKYTDHGSYCRTADYSPKGILAVLIAVKAYVEDREGVGFPGDAEDTAMMRALVRLWKRPRSWAPRWQNRHTKKVNGTVLQGLVKRWREFSSLGVYVLLTARAILAEQKLVQAAKAKALADANKAARAAAMQPSIVKLPPQFQRPLYRVTGDMEKIKQWERVEALWKKFPSGSTSTTQSPRRSTRWRRDHDEQ